MKSPANSALKPPEKILIIQTAFIGDVVLTTPLIREVKKLFPDALLDVVVIPQTKGVLENNTHIHSLIVFDKRGDKKKAFRHTAKLLRARGYDLCFLPHRSTTSALLALRAKIPRRIGFQKRFSALLINRRVFFDKSKPQIQRYLDLLRFMSNDTFDAQTELYPPQATLEKAAELLKPLQGKPIKIAIAPGSVWPTKRWPTNYFAELAGKLAAKNIGLVFIGSPAEKVLCDEIISSAGATSVLNLAGETNLLEAAAVIKSCNLLICNDSGTMHIANAVQTDVFAFFGPTVPAYGFAPFRATDKIFQIDLYCRPCRTHGGKKCPEGHFQCMRSIQAEMVFREVVRKFEESRARSEG